MFPFPSRTSTRTGTDCVGHAVRTASDRDPQATVLSIDGIGARDDVNRSPMMGKVLEVPSGVCSHSFVQRASSSPGASGPTQREVRARGSTDALALQSGNSQCFG